MSTTVTLIERIFPDGHAELRDLKGNVLRTSAPATFYINPPMDDDYIEQYSSIPRDDYDKLNLPEPSLNEQHALSLPSPTPAEVKAARIARGLDTLQAASWASVTRRAWQMYEKGDRPMKAAKFMAWLMKTAHLKARRESDT